MSYRRKSGTWQIRFWPKGWQSPPAYKTLPPSATEADAQYWDQMLNQKEQDAYTLSQGSTVGDIFPKYLEHVKAHQSLNTYLGKKSIYDTHLQGFFNTLPVSVIKNAIINEYKTEQIQKGVHNRTINKTLSCLSAMVKYCIRELDMPLQPLLYTPLPYSAPLPKILSQSEIIKLMQALREEPVFFAFYISMAIMNCRRNEIRNLRWENYEPDKKRILISTKGGKRKFGYVPDILYKMWKKITGKKEGYVFKGILPYKLKPGRCIGDPRKALWRAKERAKIPKDRRIYNHLIRHSISTWLVEQGYDISVLKALLGHSDIKTSQIYIQMSDSSLVRQASTDISNMLLGTVESSLQPVSKNPKSGTVNKKGSDFSKP